MGAEFLNADKFKWGLLSIEPVGKTLLMYGFFDVVDARGKIHSNLESNSMTKNTRTSRVTENHNLWQESFNKINIRRRNSNLNLKTIERSERIIT